MPLKNVRATIERKLGFGAGGIAASQEKALPASVEAMRDAILDQLTYAIGKAPEVASPRDWFMATALATRRRVVDRWANSTRSTYAEGSKRVYYLSLEFLIGRLLHRLAQQPRTARDHTGRAVRTRRRSRRDEEAGTRRRARQWRIGPPRRLLHGKHGQPRNPRFRLRHPLRSRPFPPDASRTAGSSSIPRTGLPSAMPGSSSGPRSPTRSASAAQSMP